MRSWTSYQTLSQNFLKFQLLTTMMNSELSLHNRGAMMIQPIKTQLGINNHMTYAGPWPTYTNLPSGPLKQEWVRATWEYSTPPF